MPTETSAPVLFRGMLRDIVACHDYHEVCRLLGLVPAGPDVEDIEHRQSHMRIDQFGEVADEALSHADVAAEVIYKLTHIFSDEEEDEDCARARAMYHLVSRTAVATVVAHLLENGTLGVER
ncbi:hypothetical protein [Streptomyces sp. NPDC057002]|uniref:hypothetical protein n=1 Tax=Streptomyces sp. NPDC057002 TaxID=3345992 RepID=UPI00362C6034